MRDTSYSSACKPSTIDAGGGLTNKLNRQKVAAALWRCILVSSYYKAEGACNASCCWLAALATLPAAGVHCSGNAACCWLTAPTRCPASWSSTRASSECRSWWRPGSACRAGEGRGRGLQGRRLAAGLDGLQQQAAIGGWHARMQSLLPCLCRSLISALPHPNPPEARAVPSPNLRLSPAVAILQVLLPAGAVGVAALLQRLQQVCRQMIMGPSVWDCCSASKQHNAAHLPPLPPPLMPARASAHPLPTNTHRCSGTTPPPRPELSGCVS